MGLVQGLGNAIGGALGIIEHAVIIFPKRTPKKINLTASAAGGGMAGLTAMNSNITPLNLAKEALSSAASASGLLSESKAAHMFGAMMEGNKFSVQFNPTTITYAAFNGGEMVVNDFRKDGKGNADSDTEIKSRIDISFKIYFDDTNNRDAFASDKGNLDMTSVAKDVGTVALKLAGKEYSVRPQVEAFHAAMRTTDGIMTFVWGENSITGQLTSINTTYTMFNPQGEPIRAYADITLTCTPDKFKDWGSKYLSQFGANGLFNSTDKIVDPGGATQQFGKMFKL